MRSIIPKIKHMLRAKKGYTLLFAVIVSVTLLSIGAFILSVSRKEAILSSSSRDSVYALYAADSGLECALENLTTLDTVIPGGSASISCGSNQQMTATQTGANIFAGTSTFYMLVGTGGTFSGNGNQTTQSGAASCATVSVGYDQTQPSSGQMGSSDYVAAQYFVAVISRGNNIGWNSQSEDCSITGPRKVERALEYTMVH